MVKTTKRIYTLEFKQQAVQLANEIGFNRAAKKLGIPGGTLHSWKTNEKMNPNVSKIKTSGASGDLKESPEVELRRLRAEIVELKKVNTILKAAAAFFSQDHLK